MAVSQRQKRLFTAEEYLALEEAAHFRSEYFKGEISAMSGGSANHNRISRNLVTSLDRALQEQHCEPFVADMRLLVKRKELYTYPDVMVVCGPLEYAKGRADTIANPTVIVEVLSPSTEAYDRGEKFESYRSIESLREYVLVDQGRVHVEVFRRTNDRRWELTVLNDEGESLDFKSLGCTITLSDIYRRVEWAQIE